MVEFKIKMLKYNLEKKKTKIDINIPLRLNIVEEKKMNVKTVNTEFCMGFWCFSHS